MHKIQRAQIVKVTFLILGLIQSLFAIAQEEKKEIQATTALPDLPSVAHSYKNFYSNAQFDFAIDPDSIAIQPVEKNEIRYSLKATSKQGAENISYEGIRCDKRQKIIYAIARSDGSWHRARSPEWSAIIRTGNNLQHTTLENDYFCTGNALSGTIESIRNRIKFNRPLNNNRP